MKSKSLKEEKPMQEDNPDQDPSTITEEIAFSRIITDKWVKRRWGDVICAFKDLIVQNVAVFLSTQKVEGLINSMRTLFKFHRIQWIIIRIFKPSWRKLQVFSRRKKDEMTIFVTLASKKGRSDLTWRGSINQKIG